jgi:hypothetical protein
MSEGAPAGASLLTGFRVIYDIRGLRRSGLLGLWATSVTAVWIVSRLSFR